MRWYTAIGAKIEQPGGAFCVQVKTEKKILSGMEIYIWNTLIWSFVEETQIYERMRKLMKLAFPEKGEESMGEDEFQFCFRRLVSRGLLVYREADTPREAAYQMFRNAAVIRVMRNGGERFLMFCESYACGTPFLKACKVFRKDALEKLYRKNLFEIQNCGEVRWYLDTAENPKEILNMFYLLYQKKLLFIHSVKEETIETAEKKE